MRVILKQEVDNLGLAGDVVDVADGYGRNYLIPRGLAIKATRGALKEAETLTRARKAHEARTIGAAQQFRELLEARTLRVPVRVDERGRLYGSVGAVEVETVLKERGHDIERRRIDVKHPIKEIGSYAASVRLHPQVTAEVPIEVIDVEGRVTAEGVRAGESSLEQRSVAAAADEQAAEGDLAAHAATADSAATSLERAPDADLVSQQET